MNKYIIVIALFCNINLFGQTNFIAFDTLDNKNYSIKLATEFKQKYKIINKNIDLETSQQNRIVKEIYIENQKSFLEDIEKNNFVNDDKINSYLQNLLTEILSSNKIDANHYKILLSTDAVVNAYNYGDGIIVINYGLFNAVENEDELVFVICHETGHQYLNHVKKEIENYAILSTSEEIVKKTSDIRRKKYQKATLATNLLNTIRYKNYKKRRQKEIEADSIGLYFYKKTLRNQENILGLFKKLEKSNIEQDSLTIADYKAFFEKGDFKLKSKYFDDDESIFQKYDYKRNANVDSLQTHPDCSTRVKLLSQKLDLKTSFAAKSKAFETFKKHSNYQNLINLLNNKEYGFCLYETLKLYKNDNQNIFLKNTIYQNLVQINKSKKNYTISRFIPDIDKTHNSKSLNTFITFINNIKTTDLELITNQFIPQK